MKGVFENDYNIDDCSGGLLKLEVTEKKIQQINEHGEIVVKLRKYYYEVGSLKEANTLIDLIEKGVNVNYKKLEL